MFKDRLNNHAFLYSHFLHILLYLYLSFKRLSLQVRYKQDWGRGFILLLLPGCCTAQIRFWSDSIDPASGFVIQIVRPRAPCCARCMGHVGRDLRFVQESHTRNSVKKRVPDGSCFLVDCFLVAWAVSKSALFTAHDRLKLKLPKRKSAYPFQCSAWVLVQQTNGKTSF